MRSHALLGDHPRMTHGHAADTIRLVIELDRGAEPIKGRVMAPGGHETPFRGWLLLTTLIESARVDSPDHAGGGASLDPARDCPSSL